MGYKINIHAHSTFSDGHNKPLTMAFTAKSLGFSALVLTDHYYNGLYPECAMVPEKEEDYSRALLEAGEVLPVIRGMEVPYGGEEVLVFGSDAIRDIISNMGIHDIKSLRNRHNCAIVLCHPSGRDVEFKRYLDGFERHNCGDDYFSSGGIIDEERLNHMKGLQSWHNSDSHSARMLSLCYNVLDKEITTEDQLIDYIKSGAEHSFEIKDIMSEEELNKLLEDNKFPKLEHERRR